MAFRIGKIYVAFLVGLLSAAVAVVAAPLEVHFIDVWQGDCTLIKVEGGKTMLIDAGSYDQRYDLYDYLQSIGVDSLDYFVATHYHSDHIGGVDGIMDQGIAIDSVFDRSWNYCSSVYDYYFQAVRYIRNTVELDRVFDLGNGVTARCVAVNGTGRTPGPNFIDRDCPGGVDADENDFSVALVVSLNNFDVFIGGDLSGYETSRYHDVEDTVGVLAGDVEVYQVNHHGSRYSSNTNFLNLIDPEVSVISCGAGNEYGHPHPEALQRLRATSDVYRTDTMGDIVLETDGLTEYTIDGQLYEIPGSGPPDSLDIELTPHDPPIFIPGEGGSFYYDALVANNTEDTLNVDVWAEIVYPDGHHEETDIFYDVDLNPGQQLEIPDQEYYVEGSLPGGEYRFLGKIGIYPEAADSSGFDFLKLNPVGIEGQDESAPLAEFSLTAYPNPFNGSFSVRLCSPRPGPVAVSLYDISGKLQGSLFDGHVEKGASVIGPFDLGQRASGIYFVRASGAWGHITRKVVFLK